GSNAAAPHVLAFCAWQLQDHRERAFGCHQPERVFKASAQACVFKDQRRMHQLDWKQRNCLFGEIDSIKFQPWEGCKALANRSNVLGIQVHTNYTGCPLWVDSLQSIA